MIIRKAVLDDAPGWHALILSVKSENLPVLCKIPDPESRTVTEGYLNSILGKEGSFVLLCFDGDVVVGCVDMTRKERPEERHVGNFGMCIRKEYRGQGIGKRLLVEMLRICKEENRMNKIEFEVYANNELGLKIYKNLGFEVEGVRKRSIVKEGKELDIILLGKSL